MSRTRQALALVATLTLLGLLLYGGCGPPGQVGCGQVVGYGPAALEALQACPRVVERLGTPLRFKLVGRGMGNYASGPKQGGAGRAWGTLPVAGPASEASVAYDLSKGGGLWHLSTMVLTFADGQQIDVAACTAAREQARGAAAMDQLLVDTCERGIAAQCEALATVRAARGDVAGATAARAKACALGLTTSCAAPAP
jgi:hypothetical protein